MHEMSISQWTAHATKQTHQRDQHERIHLQESAEAHQASQPWVEGKTSDSLQDQKKFKIKHHNSKKASRDVNGPIKMRNKGSGNLRRHWAQAGKSLGGGGAGAGADAGAGAGRAFGLGFLSGLLWIVRQPGLAGWTSSIARGGGGEGGGGVASLFQTGIGISILKIGEMKIEDGIWGCWLRGTNLGKPVWYVFTTCTVFRFQGHEFCDLPSRHTYKQQFES